MIKQFYSTHSTISLARVDLGVMTIKGFFTLLKDPGLEPHHQMQFNVIPRIPVTAGFHSSVVVQSKYSSESIKRN